MSTAAIERSFCYDIFLIHLPTYVHIEKNGGGVRYWLASPTGGPDWGLRFNVSFLFPR